MFFENAKSLPTKGETLTHDEAMWFALQEASKGASHVSPNPMVGAVVLDRHGKFLAAGHHEFYGGPHAEVNALKNLSHDQLEQASVYVTLEPCAHQGKTPSCAQMMATLPLKKVSYGLVDPNPLVSGKGAQILKQAGILAEVFKAENQSEQINFEVLLEESCEAFLWNFRHKKIFVALKMASSLDGQVALKSGESQWITSPQSRESVHYLRSCYDAVLVGPGTVKFDNPTLDIRHPQIQKKNKVVVLDPHAEILKNFDSLKLASAHEAQNLFWCLAKESEAEANRLASHLTKRPKFILVSSSVGGELDLEELLAKLHAEGIRSVMVEGGALTASSFIAQRLVNRLYLYQAPILMGAGGGRGWTENVRIDKMEDKIFLKNPRYFRFGPDSLVTGRL